MDNKRKRREEYTDVEPSSEEVKPKKNKKKRKKNQNQNEEWSSSNSEPEFEGFVDPLLISAGNLSLDITEDDIKEFFKGIGEAEVALKPITDEKNNVIEMQALIEFKTHGEAPAALKLKGKELCGSPEYLTRFPTGSITLCVTGFGPQLSEIRLLQALYKGLPWQMDDYFLAVSSPTGSNLGFFYLNVRSGDLTENDLSELVITIDGAKLEIRQVHLRAAVNEAITGDKEDLHDKIEAIEKRIQENWERKGDKETHKEVPSWRETNPELFVHYTQIENECWAVTLHRGQSAAYKLTYSKDSPLTLDMILEGVDPIFLASGRGIDKMKNTSSFMLQHVKDFKILHRPTSDCEDDFEDFEKKIISLLKEAPVGVMIDYLPSFRCWNGVGVYVPTKADLIRKQLEKVPLHGLFLSSHDTTKEGLDFWELQETAGENHGEKGFIRLARHNRLIKQVLVFKV